MKKYFLIGMLPFFLLATVRCESVTDSSDHASADAVEGTDEDPVDSDTDDDSDDDSDENTTDDADDADDGSADEDTTDDAVDDNSDDVMDTGAEDTPSLAETVTIAFIGDQGLGENSQAVLQLILSEGADMVLHSGDFDYTDDPDAWDEQINLVLGENFPYFASIGNHDEPAWEGYQQKLEDRLVRIEGATCEGDLGVNSACSYKGIFFILSGVGTYGEGHEEYIREQLAADTSVWRICSWHKNQRLMQVGGKTDEVGWEAYEECRLGGAIVATAHEHSYSRTYLMEDFENQVVSATSDPLYLETGKTFAFVSGLGGASIREQDDTLAANPWWASVYTATQNANYGALFCIFNIDGIEGEASCYFKDIDGNIPDEFNVVSLMN